MINFFNIVYPQLLEYFKDDKEMLRILTIKINQENK